LDEKRALIPIANVPSCLTPRDSDLPFVAKGINREVSDQEKFELAQSTEHEFDEVAAGRVTTSKIDLSEEFRASLRRMPV